MWENFKPPSRSDLIVEMRRNGLNTDCRSCGEPVSKRIIKDGLCPDCRPIMNNLPEKPLTVKEFMEEK